MYPETVRVIVKRASSDEMTLAIVTAKRTNETHSGPSLLANLILALTRWVAETEEGATAWVGSSEDFNVGDLSSYLPPSQELLQRLHEERVFDLSLEILHDSDLADDWTYDTVLVDAMSLLAVAMPNPQAVLSYVLEHRCELGRAKNILAALAEAGNLCDDYMADEGMDDAQYDEMLVVLETLADRPIEIK